jgi:hypothetical protein
MDAASLRREVIKLNKGGSCLFQTYSQPYLPSIKFEDVQRPRTSGIGSMYKRQQHPMYQTSNARGGLKSSQSARDKTLPQDHTFTKTYPDVFRDTSIGSLRKSFFRAERTRKLEFEKTAKQTKWREDLIAGKEEKKRLRRELRDRRRKQAQLEKQSALILAQHTKAFLERNREWHAEQARREAAARRIQDRVQCQKLLMMAKAEKSKRMILFAQREAIKQIEECYIHFAQRKEAKAVLRLLMENRELMRESLVVEVQTRATTTIQALHRGGLGRRQALTLMEQKNQATLMKEREEQMRNKIEADLRRRETERPAAKSPKKGGKGGGKKKKK